MKKISGCGGMCLAKELCFLLFVSLALANKASAIVPTNELGIYRAEIKGNKIELAMYKVSQSIPLSSEWVNPETIQILAYMPDMSCVLRGFYSTTRGKASIRYYYSRDISHKNFCKDRSIIDARFSLPTFKENSISVTIDYAKVKSKVGGGFYVGGNREFELRAETAKFERVKEPSASFQSALDFELSILQKYLLDHIAETTNAEKALKQGIESVDGYFLVSSVGISSISAETYKPIYKSQYITAVALEVSGLFSDYINVGQKTYLGNWYPNTQQLKVSYWRVMPDNIHCNSWSAEEFYYPFVKLSSKAGHGNAIVYKDIGDPIREKFQPGKLCTAFNTRNNLQGCYVARCANYKDVQKGRFYLTKDKDTAFELFRSEVLNW